MLVVYSGPNLGAESNCGNVRLTQSASVTTRLEVKLNVAFGSDTGSVGVYEFAVGV
jgi:hypothetical protein